MNRDEIFYVVIAAPPNIDAELIKQTASIVELEPIKIRSLLSTKIPRIVTQYRAAQEAESIVGRLKGLGLIAFVCVDSELRKQPGLFFQAKRLKIDKNEVIFSDNTGMDLIIKRADILLIMVCTRTNKTVETVTSSKMKFNLPATLLTGGFPVFRKVKEETSQNLTQEARFVRFYTLNSIDPVVEISQNGFDYSFLGTKIAASSRINLNTMIAELKVFFPQAIFDDRLDNDVNLEERIEIDCRLIYLYNRNQRLKK
jgi:hypothetical protein